MSHWKHLFDFSSSSLRLELTAQAVFLIPPSGDSSHPKGAGTPGSSPISCFLWTHPKSLACSFVSFFSSSSPSRSEVKRIETRSAREAVLNVAAWTEGALIRTLPDDGCGFPLKRLPRLHSSVGRAHCHRTSRASVLLTCRWSVIDNRWNRLSAPRWLPLPLCTLRLQVNRTPAHDQL
jgi:hypothetical protein